MYKTEKKPLFRILLSIGLRSKVGNHDSPRVLIKAKEQSENLRETITRLQRLLEGLQIVCSRNERRH